MYELLTDMGVTPLVAEFIARPEWLHIGTAFVLMLFVLGVAYILRLDLDPFIYGRRQPFSAIIERLIFYPAVIGTILLTYYGEWDWPDPVPEGFYFNKFTLGIGVLLVLILGRVIIHLVTTEKNHRDFFDQLPFYLMVEFQFFVPLVSYNALERNMLMPKEELGFALTSIFLMYFVMRWLLGRPVHLPRNPVAPWVWMFIGYMLLTVIFLPHRLAAVKNVIQWIAFASCFLIGLAYIPDKRRRDIVLITAVIAALVSTFWGFWKYFDVPLNVFGLEKGVYEAGDLLAGQPYFYKTPSAGRYFLLAGLFANPNYYGEYLALTLFVGLGLLFATNSKKLRLFLTIALAINSFEMVALYNRAGWLGIFFGAFFVGFGLLWARVPIFKRISKIGLAVGVIGLVLILILTNIVFHGREADETPLSGTPYERLVSMTDFTDDETFRNRLTMWRASYLMLADEETFPQRLIFGGGFGFFEVNYLPYQTEILETYNFNEWFHNVIPTFRAHNDHIQMLVEAGLIGTILYALVFIMFFIYGFRYIKEEEDPARRIFALGILGATACMLATAFFSFPLHKIQHGGFIFIAMAILIADIVARKQELKLASEDESTNSPAPASRKKKKQKKAFAEAKIPAITVGAFSPAFYISVRKKLQPGIIIPLMIIALFVSIWGVYTQVVNFKSQYFVVKGIAALRNIQGDSNPQRKAYIGQIAADFFADAYKLDPTNGRAEFFRGFSLIKKNTYEDVVSGTEHLEEGQLLYPQSDTHYALAMGYEARRNLANQLAREARGQITALEEQLTDELPDENRAEIEEGIENLNKIVEDLKTDAEYSQEKAIVAYRTAAQYYPVKIEYYKELIRLLEDELRHEEIIFWAERALLVDDWLLKKPPIRWQFYLWLGKAHRALGAQSIQEGDIEAGMVHLKAAKEALLGGRSLSGRVYYTWYELAQVYEAYGDIATESGHPEEAAVHYELSRDMYIETFNRKDNIPNKPPFDYAYFLLGRIYEKLGDNDRAVNYYNQLLTQSLYGPNTETYQKARTRIFEITGEWVGEARAGDTAAEETVSGEPG